MIIEDGTFINYNEDNAAIFAPDGITLINRISYSFPPQGDIKGARQFDGYSINLTNAGNYYIYDPSVFQVGKGILSGPLVATSVCGQSCSQLYYTQRDVPGVATKLKQLNYVDGSLAAEFTLPYFVDFLQVSLDATVYAVDSAAQDTVKCWDLNTDSALPALVTKTGFKVTGLLPTYDGKLIVTWRNDDLVGNTGIIYNSNGSIYGTFVIPDSTNVIGMSLDSDWSNSIFWLCRFNSSLGTQLLKYNYSSTPAIVKTINNGIAGDGEFGFSVLPASDVVQQWGGVYALTPGATHDQIWLGDSAVAAVKIPDPFAVTALFGDEP